MYLKDHVVHCHAHISWLVALLQRVHAAHAPRTYADSVQVAALRARESELDSVRAAYTAAEARTDNLGERLKVSGTELRKAEEALRVQQRLGRSLKQRLDDSEAHCDAQRAALQSHQEHKGEVQVRCLNFRSRGPSCQVGLSLAIGRWSSSAPDRLLHGGLAKRQVLQSRLLNGSDPVVHDIILHFSAGIHVDCVCELERGTAVRFELVNICSAPIHVSKHTLLCRSCQRMQHSSWRLRRQRPGGSARRCMHARTRWPPRKPASLRCTRTCICWAPTRTTYERRWRMRRAWPSVPPGPPAPSRRE